MSEKLNNYNNQQEQLVTPERNKDVQQPEQGFEQRSHKESIIDNQEEKNKLYQEAKEKAREKAKENDKKHNQEKDAQNRDKGYGYISKKQKTISYKKTLKRLQSEMNPVEKVFSQVIHNPLVEKGSEIISRTIARPRPILLGSALSFLLVSLLYVIAKKLGYRLSGSETILVFFVGWGIGLTYDYFKKIIETNKK